MEEKSLKSLQDVDLSPDWFPIFPLKRVPFFAMEWGWRNPVKWRIVEKGGNMSNFFVEDLEGFQINMGK